MSQITKENDSLDKKSLWNTSTKLIKKEYKLESLSYEAICGEILVDSPSGDVEKRDSAKVFYTAYLCGGIRPLMFCFNGGPGSSSVWIQLVALVQKLSVAWMLIKTCPHLSIIKRLYCLPPILFLSIL